VKGAACRRRTGSAAVVEGDGREGLTAVSEPRRHLVERDELETHLVDEREHAVEEFRRDLEKPVRRKRASHPWPDMVEHQDHAGALRERAQPAIGAQGGGRHEAGGEQVVAQRAHAKSLAAT
jgi:hypothetical protein